MLGPLDAVEVDAFLNKLPQWAELAQEGHALLHGLQHVVDLGLGGEASNTESDTGVCALVTAAECAENVRWLEGSGGTRTTGRQRNVLQSHKKGLSLDVGEGNVDATWVEGISVSVLGGVLHGQKSVQETIRKLLDVLGVILIAGQRSSTTICHTNCDYPTVSYSVPRRHDRFNPWGVRSESHALEKHLII